MRTRILIIMLLTGIISVNAQRIEKSKFGVQAGWDVRNFSVTDPDKGTFFLDGKNNFRAGVNWDIRMGEHMLLETGLFYTQLKGKIKYSSKSYSYNSGNHTTSKYLTFVERKFNTNLVELPLLLGYQFDCWKLGIQIKAGGYVNYALGGKFKVAGTSSATTTGGGIFKHVSDKGKDELDYDDIHENMDSGIQTEVGFHWQGCYLGFAYQIGLMTLNKSDKTNYDDLKSRNFSIKLGYYF